MKENDLQWALELSEKIKAKEKIVVERSQHKFVPYCAKDGIWEARGAYEWTAGFWGGIMWQLYYSTKDIMYKEIAENLERKMDETILNSRFMNHDSGFRWLPTSFANYLLTGSEASFNRFHLVADSLCGRFNPVGRFIRAWENDLGPEEDRSGWAIIDCMMNLPLLYRAYEEMKDPRYLHIARMHADTTMKYFVREDGSVCHIVAFDPMTGEFQCSYGGQGYAEGSSWTRGQSWALYGFVLSYMHTGEDRYLKTAEKVADYFISCIPADGLIPVDFCQPDECEWEDSTAAAIAACGLLELRKYVGTESAERYYDNAIFLLKTLADCRCNWKSRQDNLLENCSGAYWDRQHNIPLMYADYFFIEAIWKLTGEDVFFW